MTDNIKKYKRAYHRDVLIRKLIIKSTAFIVSSSIISVTEYIIEFNSTTRSILFYGILSVGFLILIELLRYLYIILNKSKQISDDESAIKIGNHFSSVRDKLLNLLQLKNFKNPSELVTASIKQKEKEFETIKFEKSVNTKKSREYTKYFLALLLILIISISFFPSIFTQSSIRILHYNKDFIAGNSFSFKLHNKSLSVLKNENILIQVSIEEDSSLRDIFVLSDKNKFSMNYNPEANVFQYSFRNMQKNTNIQFEASGFTSSNYIIKVIPNQSLENLSVFLNYPNYTQKKDEIIKNTGNLIVPQGTTIEWNLETSNSKGVSLSFEKPSLYIDMNKLESNKFFSKKRVFTSSPYSLNIFHNSLEDTNSIAYYLEIIPDDYPSIYIQQYGDTIFYKDIYIEGEIMDDYGISSLRMNYRVISNTKNTDYQSVDISFNRKLNAQSFLYKFNLQQYEITNNETLEYYIEVKDNDAVNGNKSIKTRVFQFKIPDSSTIDKLISKKTETTKSDLKNTSRDIDNLKSQLLAIEEKIKGKKKLQWEDKVSIEKLIKKRELVTEEIKKLQSSYEKLRNYQEQIGAEEDIVDRMEYLKKDIERLMRNENLELYNKLEKNLNEDSNREIEETLNEILFNENNLQYEINRIKELFKQLEFKQKTYEISKKLNELSKKQEDISYITEESEDILKSQKDINRKYSDIDNSINELKELNKHLKRKRNINPTEDIREEITNLQKSIENNLTNKKTEQSSKEQRRLSNSFKKLSERLTEEEKNIDEVAIKRNYQSLRQILDNLLLLSFEQESLMEEITSNQNYTINDINQKQITILEISDIINDSLLNIGKEVEQLQSFISKEVSLVKRYIEKALENLKAKRLSRVPKNQQLAMSSINNLALLLSDLLNNMQSKLNPSRGDQNKQNQKLSDMQKTINQDIMKLSDQQRQGHNFSKQLAKISAQQELIRQALMKQAKMEGTNNDKELIEKIKQTEQDLINKKLDNHLIDRQKQILTRLLDSEKSDIQKEDKERESEISRQRHINSPIDIDEYLRKRNRELEIFKTIDPQIIPYYKKNINKYFESIRRDIE